MGFVAVEPGGAGDVEVGPFGFVDELLDEDGAHDGAGFAARADVFDIGDVRFDLFAVFGTDRKLPESFAVLFAEGDDLVHQALIVAHDAGVLIAESDDDGSGDLAEDEVATETIFDGAGRVLKTRTANPNSIGGYTGRSRPASSF